MTEISKIIEALLDAGFSEDEASKVARMIMEED